MHLFNSSNAYNKCQAFVLDAWNIERANIQSLALGRSQSNGGDRLDRSTVKLIVIRALNLGNQGVWRVGGRRERRWGGWDHFKEKVYHEWGGKTEGLGVGWDGLGNGILRRLTSWSKQKFRIMRH